MTTKKLRKSAQRHTAQSSKKSSPATPEKKPLDYPYISAYAKRISSFAPTEETYPPRSIAVSKNADASTGLLNGSPTTLSSPSTDEPAQIVVDFGREIVGDFVADVTVTSTCTVMIRYGENLDEALRTDCPNQGWYRLPKDEFTLSPGRQTLRNRGRRGYRFVNISLTGSPGCALIHSLRAVHRHYPITARGSFRSSDALLNRMWNVSQNTVECCMQQFYEDGVKRDGLLWIADFRVTYLANVFAFGDAALARKCLYMIAASQRSDGALPACSSRGGGHQHPHIIEYMFREAPLSDWMLTNFSADFAGCLREYYLFTGDITPVKELHSTTVRLLDFLGTRTDLPPLQPQRDFITDNQVSSGDWWGSHGALACQLIRAADDIAALSRLVNDTATVRRCAKYRAVMVGILKRYYLPDLKVYGDEEGSATSLSQHVNAYALLAGLVDARECRAIFDRLAALPDVRYPNAGLAVYPVLLAKFMAGMPGNALSDMRAYFGHMIDRDSVTAWERLDIAKGIDLTKGVPSSLCHGWGASPCFLLPSQILGIQPTEPGFTKVRISPELADLQWAEGTFPTPQGEISVRWEAGTVVRGRVVLPKGVTGTAMVSGKKVSLKSGINEIG